MGGAKGSILFFPPEIKDKIEHGEVRNLASTVVAVVNYKGTSGENERYTNPDPSMINGTSYRLEFENGYCAAKEPAKAGIIREGEEPK